MSKKKGDIGELAFSLQARRKGLRICFPMDSDSPYDIIVDNNHRFYRIQVKTTSNIIVRHGKTMHRAYKVNISQGANKKKLYKSCDVDYFAIYIYQEDKFFIIPHSEITTVSTNLYTDKEDHRFYKYLENFDLLK